jgi:hypothetical protein
MGCSVGPGRQAPGAGAAHHLTVHQDGGAELRIVLIHSFQLERHRSDRCHQSPVLVEASEYFPELDLRKFGSSHPMLLPALNGARAKRQAGSHSEPIVRNLSVRTE